MCIRDRLNSDFWKSSKSAKNTKWNSKGSRWRIFFWIWNSIYTFPRFCRWMLKFFQSIFRQMSLLIAPTPRPHIHLFTSVTTVDWTTPIHSHLANSKAHTLFLISESSQIWRFLILERIQDWNVALKGQISVTFLLCCTDDSARITFCYPPYPSWRMTYT